MIRRPCRGLVVLALPLALLAPGAAHAEKVVTEDAGGDVEAYWYDLAYYPAPQEAAADITRTVAALGHRRLAITVHLRDLETRARHNTSVRVRTPQATFDVTARRRSASRPRVSMADRDRGKVRCRALRVAYDGAADEVALSIPAACIGSPRWVRLGVGTASTPVTNPDNPSPIILFADDGHRDALRPETLFGGPRIHRG